MDSDEMLPLPIPKKKSWSNSSNTNDKHSTDKHRKRSPSDHKKKDRDYRDLLGSTRELARLLAYEDSRELQRSLVDVTGQLKAETLRANEAERKLKETTLRFKTVNDARMAAQQEVARLNEELQLYKLQLDTAQNEIFRAQEILTTVDAQRLEAEQDAAHARSTARKLREEALIERAREHGRQLGLAEGLARGKDIGYHQGRTSGYEHGRSNAEQAIERYYEPVPMVQEYRRISSDDSSYPSLDEYGPPPPPPRPATTTPVPIPIPPPTRRASPSGDIHPIPIHNSAASPLHPAVDIPPDGWIPEADGDSVIRLPPPHEMARPPPSPGSSRSSSPPLPPVPSDEEPIRMIPGPRYGFGETSHRPGLHRRSSSYSSQGSTTISQLELVGPPSEARRRSGLSVIQEVASILTDGSPNPGQSSGDMPSIYETTPHSPPRMTIPTPMIAVSGASGLEEQVRGDVYQRPHSLSGSSDEAVVREISRKKSRRMSPASLYSVPEINIQPPTRPPSNVSQQQQPAAAQSTSDFLSPADADRPMTLPHRPPSEAPNTPSTLVFPGGSAPTSLPDGRLPAGFVPTTAYTANGVPLAPSALSSVGPLSTDDSFFGGPAHSMPGGFASNPSQHPTNGPLEPIYFPSDASPHDPSDAVVIPPPSLRSYLSPGMAGVRRSGSTDSDDDTSSVASSLNTLTTPPPRARRATPAAAYASAPTPPGMSYPLPTPGPSYARTPSASSRVTHGSAAAAVALPSSTVAGTPRATGSAALKSQASKSSLRSQRSHKRFNQDSYVDPAFLASSENVHETN